MSLITINAEDVIAYHGSLVPAFARLYANMDFRTSGGVNIAKGSEAYPDFYQKFTASMNGVNIRIASGTAYSTTKAIVNPEVQYSLVVYDAAGTKIKTVFTGLKIPPENDPTTWSALQIYSTGKLLAYAPTYLDSNAILALFGSLISAALKATATIFGVVRLDKDPSPITEPVAVGINSPLLDSTIINVARNGLVADGVTDNTAALNALITAAAAANAKTIFLFPASNNPYIVAGQINLNGARKMIWRAGSGGSDDQAGQTTNAPVEIRYTGTANPGFILGHSQGCIFERIAFIASNPAFTGDVVSTNLVSGGVPTHNVRFVDCEFGGITTAKANRSGLFLAGVVSAVISGCKFRYSKYGILGTDAAGTAFATAVTVTGQNWFWFLSVAGIANPHQQWGITENVFEPLENGNAGGIVCGVEGGIASDYGCFIERNGFWDMTTGAGAWIKWKGHDLVVRNNFISIGTLAKFVLFERNCSGFVSSGNHLQDAGAGFVDYAGFAVTQVMVDGTDTIGATYNNTAQVGYASQSFRAASMKNLISVGAAASIAGGTGAGTGPTLVNSGNDMAGRLTVTPGTTPAASALVFKIQFVTAYAAAPKLCILTPANAAAAALTGNAQVFVDRANINTFEIPVNVGSSALIAGTVYQWDYHVVQ